MRYPHICTEDPSTALVVYCLPLQEYVQQVGTHLELAIEAETIINLCDTIVPLHWCQNMRVCVRLRPCRIEHTPANKPAAGLAVGWPFDFSSLVRLFWFLVLALIHTDPTSESLYQSDKRNRPAPNESRFLSIKVSHFKG